MQQTNEFGRSFREALLRNVERQNGDHDHDHDHGYDRCRRGDDHGRRRDHDCHSHCGDPISDDNREERAHRPRGRRHGKSAERRQREPRPANHRSDHQHTGEGMSPVGGTTGGIMCTVMNPFGDAGNIPGQNALVARALAGPEFVRQARMNTVLAGQLNALRITPAQRLNQEPRQVPQPTGKWKFAGGDSGNQSAGPNPGAQGQGGMGAGGDGIEGVARQFELPRGPYLAPAADGGDDWYGWWDEMPPKGYPVDGLGWPYEGRVYFHPNNGFSIH